ncbi:MAG: threonine synthase [Bacteroidales bacterium]
MILYNSNNRNDRVTLKEAVLQGSSNDGGLYLPTKIERFSKEEIENFRTLSFTEIATEVALKMLDGAIEPARVEEMVNESLPFSPTIVELQDGLSILELFNGPTLAFKDYGANFMASLLSHFSKEEERKITVLVATSGDTGSAVAHALHLKEGIRVIVLYPSGRVSTIQEQQLTTLGGNITAVEVSGSFDHCQALVKEAFRDQELRKRVDITSANSINIARLLPQSFYYFYGYSRLNNRERGTIFSVPSGNLGNLTAGVVAMKMGLPIERFIAANNINNTFSHYIRSGRFTPKEAQQTISNAMDVGDPNNFPRLKLLFNESYSSIVSKIWSGSYSDTQVKAAMRELLAKEGYLLDPHGAVGYLAIEEYKKRVGYDNNHNYILLESAHPAKFADIVEEATGVKVDIPQRLQREMERKRDSVKIEGRYSELVEIIEG